MDSITEFQISEINKYIEPESAFICFASFEKRCLTVAQSIDPSRIRESYVIRNVDSPMDRYNKDNLCIIREILEKIKVKEISLNLPANMAETIISIIRDIQVKSIENVYVDITTFTHEALLVLIYALYNDYSIFKKIILFYNGAAEYSPWLSKGCKEIRNVIGYPGMFNPSYKNHMVILTGFEQERATKLVELFEPEVLSVGNGYDPTDENHMDTMQDMKDKFNAWLEDLGRIKKNTFEFSCKNIEETVDDLKNILEQEEKQNYVLVPLNTKLSTISVALVALQKKRIQVVYPVPEVYNLEYSKPGGKLTMIDLTSITEFCDRKII